MEYKSKQGQRSTRHLNDYETSRRLRIQENQKKLHALGVTGIVKSLTSIVHSDKRRKRKNKTMDTSDKNEEYMPDSVFDGDGEQVHKEEDATTVRVSKKKQQPKYIALMSMNRYANLAKQRVVAPNVSNVLTSSKSNMKKGQVIDTRRAISSTHIFCDMNEEQNGKENDAIEDIDVNYPYEELDSFEDDGDEEMDDCENNLENENDLENDIDVTYPYEEHELLQPENEAGLFENGNEVLSENDEVVREEHEVRQPENEAVGNVRKRVRGPTHMPKVWAQEKGDLIPILVNALGQPINDKSSQLTHFMGTLSRSGKYCPIHKPWNKVSAAKKQTLLEFLKTKFDIPEGAETWILKSFGRKVKNWRARVKELYHDASLSLQEQINSRPKQVQTKQWTRLVKYWNKEKSKSINEKNKTNRAKKKMVQVTGKKSYARVREELKADLGQDPSRLEMFRKCFSKDGTTKNVEAANAIAHMQEISSKLPEGSVDKPGLDDVFSKVIGNDRNGDADMYGLGVRASDVWGVLPSRAACRRENILLKCKIDQLTAQLAETNGSRDGSSNPAFTSPQCPVVANGPRRLQVGDEVLLKSILNSTETVARGWVKSLDPNEQVGGKEIGREWCEVNVQVAIKRDEYLVRPYGLFITIEDAIGASITWPCPFISVVRED